MNEKPEVVYAEVSKGLKRRLRLAAAERGVPMKELVVSLLEDNLPFFASGVQRIERSVNEQNDTPTPQPAA
jgi:hypothetical protein